jgi:DSF synthase
VPTTLTSQDFHPAAGSYQQLEVSYDPDRRAVWYFLDPVERPCFNLELLEELRQFQHQVVSLMREAEINGDPSPIRYTILASKVPGIFNMGGDLKLFSRLIRNNDGRGLFSYAKACIDVLYPNSVNFDLSLTTISLVQGDALGGGFEAAISSNCVIAEEGIKWGLPEVLFNLVPGMGAYSFLTRRAGPDTAERLIMSGKMLSSHDMLKHKVIDKVVPTGGGEQAVLDFIDKQRRRDNAHLAMARIRRCINPITYQELIQITKIWVDAALQLGDRDLLLIERLIAAQNRRQAQARSEAGGASPRAMEGQG